MPRGVRRPREGNEEKRRYARDAAARYRAAVAVPRRGKRHLAMREERRNFRVRTSTSAGALTRLGGGKKKRGNDGEVPSLREGYKRRKINDTSLGNIVSHHVKRGSLRYP